MPISEAEQQLLADVRKDKAAFERLQAKARWEGCSIYAVLREWGDPRKWPE